MYLYYICVNEFKFFDTIRARVCFLNHVGVGKKMPKNDILIVARYYRAAFRPELLSIIKVEFFGVIYNKDKDWT